MSKTDDQLRSESAVNESRAEWSAGAVIFGLFLEVALATARSVELDVKPALENWGTVVADALIAMGVFCELLFGRRASHGNAELRRRSEKMVAELTVRAAEANEKALEAQLALEKYRKPWALPIWKHLARANTFSRFAATPYR